MISPLIRVVRLTNRHGQLARSTHSLGFRTAHWPWDRSYNFLNGILAARRQGWLVLIDVAIYALRPRPIREREHSIGMFGRVVTDEDSRSHVTRSHGSASRLDSTIQ